MCSIEIEGCSAIARTNQIIGKDNNPLAQGVITLDGKVGIKNMITLADENSKEQDISVMSVINEGHTIANDNKDQFIINGYNDSSDQTVILNIENKSKLKSIDCQNEINQEKSGINSYDDHDNPSVENGLNESKDFSEPIKPQDEGGQIASKDNNLQMKSNIRNSRQNEGPKNRKKFLFELRRLKCQQKYLECSQVKLLAKNFSDDYPLPKNLGNRSKTSEARTTSSMSLLSTSSSACPSIPPSPSLSSLTVPTLSSSSLTVVPPSVSSSLSTAPPSLSMVNVSQIINEIGEVKGELDMTLVEYRQQARADIEDIQRLIKQIKEDISETERLRTSSMQVLRERTININSQLDKLYRNNAKELLSLQNECQQLESDTKTLIKWIT